MDVEKNFFEPFVGKAFDVVADDLDEPLKLELFKLDNVTFSGLATARKEPFSALFKGPRDRILNSKIHKLVCEGTHFELMLQVIIYPEISDGVVYEAIFN